MRWRDLAEEPDGPLAWLTVEFLAELMTHMIMIFPPPPAAREMDYDATVRLVYRMPVASTETSRVRRPLGNAGPADLARFGATGVTSTANTRGMTRVEIGDEGGRPTVRGFGSCSPSDCDWGVTSARIRGGVFEGTWDFGWQQTRLRARRQGDQLLPRLRRLLGKR